MHRQASDDPRRRRSPRGLPVLVYALLAGCAAGGGATTTAVVIHGDSAPVGGNEKALTDYYGTVFARMRDALVGGTRDDLLELRTMLEVHDRPDLVAFARPQMDRFRVLAQSLEFELDLPRRCSIEPVAEKAYAHSNQRYRFRMKPYEDDRVVHLGGSDERQVGFRVGVRVRDFDATGQFLEASDAFTLLVGEEMRIAKGADFVREFELPGARAESSIRELQIRIEMLPGVVRVDDQDLSVSMIHGRKDRTDTGELPPARRISGAGSVYAFCCAYSRLLYPEGFEVIREKPLQTLEAAVRRGSPNYFRHVFLAAHFMPETDHERAMARLVTWVRTGSPDQGQVAMGCLRVLSREDIPVTDRRAWLRWWQIHKSKSNGPK